MITDVPTPEDFRQAGIGFLNLGWVPAYELIRDFREIDETDYWGHDQRDYWNAAQRPLATALALAQQGIELLLKARIVEVSPFLLLDCNWCKGNDRSDTSFADLRTIDSQDLIRAHDTVQSNRLPDDFKNRVNDLRRQRNSIFHTVDKRLQLTAADVLFAILDAAHYLIGPKAWIRIRRDSYTQTPAYMAYGGDDFLHGALAQEVATVVELFLPSDVFRLLGLNKKQRRYLCYDCQYSSLEFHNKLDCRFATLKPKTAGSTKLYCLACDEETDVRRVKCDDPNCKGDVIHDDNVCLTCWKDQTPVD